MHNRTEGAVLTTPRTETREARGIRLFRERGHEIREVEPGIFRVPSSTGRGFYRVDLERETCECKDHEHRRVRCLHFYAVTIFAAKRHCRRRRATTDRSGRAPQRRHGRPGERHGGTTPGRGGNRSAPADTTTPPASGSVGWGYGVGKATVLAELERMGS